jgi:aminoglycoside phosphotransferase (APT) family kinase protein
MGYEPDTTDVAEELLHNLRGRLGSDSVDYAEAPERIHGGFDTFIYGFSLRGAPQRFSGRLILRLYRPDTDPRQACFESTIQNVLAAAGYPSPPVLLVGRAGDGLGLPFVVMPRVPGRLMLDTLWGPTAIRMSTTLARAQSALHSIDPEPVRRALTRAGWPDDALAVERELRDVEREIERAMLGGLRPGTRWLASNRPRSAGDTVVCHGDLHPLNVLVDGGRISGVIDWSERRLRLGDPAYDVGATVAILSHGPVDVPDLLVGPITLGRRCFVAAYLRAYARDRPLDRERVRYYEALRCLIFLVEVGASRQAAAGVIPAILKRSAFGDDRTVRGVMRRFQAITGTDVGMPAAG